MKKHKINKFGEHYFLGIDQDNKKVYLQKASWDCGWYWGFGYLRTFTNNNNPEVSRDISSHTHFDSEIINGKSHAFNNFKNYFKRTPLTDNEIWQLCDYMSTFYNLKKSAEIFGRGYSHYTEKAKLDIIKNNEITNKINKEMLPALFEKIEELLT
mgnify:CR=1 FL=1